VETSDAGNSRLMDKVHDGAATAGESTEVMAGESTVTETTRNGETSAGSNQAASGFRSVGHHDDSADLFSQTQTQVSPQGHHNKQHHDPRKEQNPAHVGICALEVYFPSLYVSQAELEVHDDCVGRYTEGLGQARMACCTDREDSVSMALTVASRLLSKFKVDPSEIGRIEVGTESAVDGSKSIATELMVLLERSGNTTVHGADNTSACYAGTHALLNACIWISSDVFWDGRFALVVAVDILMYREQSARPTGGAGSVALLVGRNAPLSVDPRLMAHHMQHMHHMKPVPSCERSPQVCYLLDALRKCHQRLQRATSQAWGPPSGESSAGSRVVDGATLLCFHSPYNKLVKHAVAELVRENLRPKCRDSADSVVTRKCVHTTMEFFVNSVLHNEHLPYISYPHTCYL
jgi:3-hydroxy-3-methylglutaryl-CoA-synthase